MIDGESGEPLPFANVAVESNGNPAGGSTTDFDGKFYLETQWGTSILQASFVGYKTASKNVKVGGSNTIHFLLKNDAVDMAEKIVQLLDDEDARKRMGAFGRNRVVNELEWRYEAPKFLRAYESL